VQHAYLDAAQQGVNYLFIYIDTSFKRSNSQLKSALVTYYKRIIHVITYMYHW